MKTSRHTKKPSLPSQMCIRDSNQAIERIEALPFVRSKVTRLRVEHLV